MLGMIVNHLFGLCVCFFVQGETNKLYRYKVKFDYTVLIKELCKTNSW